MSGDEFEIGGPAEHEWSHFIESNDIGGKVVSIDISPPDADVSAICKRLNLYAINVLKATIQLQRNNVNKVIHIHGTIHADILQKCVVTTDPVQENIEEEFDAWFADPNSAVSFIKAKRERMSREERNEQAVMEEKEDPEDVIDGKIDLGELVVQHMSLSLNPYPRLDGAEHETDSTNELGEAPEGTYNNPFAALKDWKASEAKKAKKEK